MILKFIFLYLNSFEKKKILEPVQTVSRVLPSCLEKIPLNSISHNLALSSFKVYSVMLKIECLLRFRNSYIYIKLFKHICGRWFLVLYFIFSFCSTFPFYRIILLFLAV